MFLTAHRAVRPGSHQQGINAFSYLHNRLWHGEPPDDIAEGTAPVTLFRSEIAVSLPHGNRIRSYLDILAPNGTTPSQILLDLNHVVGFADSLPLPWFIDSGNCRFSFGVDLALAPAWGEELAALIDAILRVAPQS